MIAPGDGRAKCKVKVARLENLEEDKLRACCDWQRREVTGRIRCMISGVVAMAHGWEMEQ